MGTKKGFTLLELLVITVIVLIAGGLMLPVISRAGDDSEGVKCAANLRKIGAAVLAYAEDFDGWIPAALADGQTWITRMRGHGGSKVYLDREDDAWQCPSREGSGGYGMNGYHRFARGRNWFKVDELIKASEHLLVTDSGKRGANFYVMPDEFQPENIHHGRIDYRHAGGSNALFADGSVEWGDDWRAKPVRPFWLPEKNPAYLESLEN